MANPVHRQMLQNNVNRTLRLSTQPAVRAPRIAYPGRPSCHQAGNTRLSAHHTKAQKHSEHAASSAPSPAEADAVATTSGSAATAAAAAGSNNEGSPNSAGRDLSTPDGSRVFASTKTTTTSERSASTSASNSNSKTGGGEDPDEGLSSLELATATSCIEKIAGALVMYSITVLLANLSGVNATADLLWEGGAPLGVGVAAAVPVVAGIALLFLPSLDLGMSQEELSAVGEVDQEMDSEGLLLVPYTLEGDHPPFTPKALKQGLWLYQMNVLKPWYPSFQWSSVGVLYLASCTASSAQELLVRGYGGSMLEGWYNGVLAGTTDVNNPIYWAKVFNLVTPETSRWLAAISLIALQVALSSSSASRAAAFARRAISRTGRAASQPGLRGVLVQNMSVTLEPGVGLKPAQEEGGTGGGGGSKVQGDSAMLLALPTAEERVVYWANLGVSMLLCGATNLAWAASGSLLGSFTAQVVIDGVVTTVQQFKFSRLPEKELWEAVQQQEDSDSDSE